jgi:hypothetical protein
VKKRVLLPRVCLRASAVPLASLRREKLALVLATRGHESIAVEVDIGDREVLEDVRHNLRAGYRVVVAATSRAGLAPTRRNARGAGFEAHVALDLAPE